MGKIISTKVHTRIGHERSLCGLAPIRGHYHIASFSSFFTAKPEDQCARCIQRLKERGYDIEKERARFGAVYKYAQDLALIP